MENRPQFSASLETVLAKIERKERSFWGRMQSWNHRWLARLEAHPLILNYGGLFRKRRDAVSVRPGPTIDLDSVFLLSLLFHLILLFLLMRLSVATPRLKKPEPILIRMFDLGKPSQAEKGKPTKKRNKIAKPKRRPSPSSRKAKPKKIAKIKRRPSPSLTKTKPKSVPPAPKPKPLLPAPKVLAETPSEKVTGLAGEPVEQLVQLPTHPSEGSQVSVATQVAPLLAEIPAQGTSLPKTLRRGESAPRVALGGSKGLEAVSSPDFAPYFKMIERRVRSVWKYPKGISGSHQVYLRFALDRAGKLLRVEVLDSRNARLSRTAVEAMKRASPFPPIPASLQSLAGKDLGFKFTIDIGVRRTR
ncbi:MAG: TonB family protein [Candidatus Binatia bacterium]